MIINLLIIITFNLFLYLFFHKLISQKWLPNKNTIITITIGLLLVPISILIEKFFKVSGFLSEHQYNLIVVIIEEVLKLIPIFIILNIIKFRKFTFLEILGIGLGFAFLESIIYGQGNILSGSYLYPGLPTTLYVSFLTLILRSLGALILHISTVALMGLTLIYLKNKKKLFILIILPVSVYIHYLFNEYTSNNSEHFLTAFIIISLIFITIYSIYVYINSKIEKSEKIKTIVIKISKFTLKYLILYILCFGLLVSIDQINFLGLPRYSAQEIEQTKISQNKTRESANSWQSEEVINRYKESTNELSRIKEIYTEIDNNYSRIIQIMEENKEELSLEDKEFLNPKESKLSDELKRLRDTINIRPKISTWKSEIKGMIITQDNYLNYLINLNLPDNIVSDISQFNDSSDYIISADNIIISKIESNQELLEEEINYSNNDRKIKMDELIIIYDRLTKYFINK